MKSAKIAIVPAISRLNCDFSLKTRDLLHIRPLPTRFLRPFLWGVGKTSVQRARSSAVEHFVDIEGVTSSNLVSPTIEFAVLGLGSGHPQPPRRSRAAIRGETK